MTRLKNILRHASEVLGARSGLLVWGDDAIGYPEEGLGPKWRAAALELARGYQAGQVTSLGRVAWPSADSIPTRVLAAALVVDGQKTGMLAVFGTEGALVHGERQVLHAYASAASLAIQQADLKEREALDRRRAGELASIADYGYLGVLSWSVEASMEYLVKWTAALMGASQGSIMLLDERRKQFSRAFSLGSESGVTRPAKRRLGEGIAGWVAKEGNPLLIADVSKNGRFASTDRGVEDAVCVPLKVEDEVIGVVLVAGKAGLKRFDKADLETLVVLAKHAAAVLARAMAHQEAADFVAGGERSRLAGEIHDGMIQELTGTVLQLELAEKLRGKDPERELQHSQKAKERARRSLDQLRQLTSDLRLSVVKELGLAEALRGHITEFTTETGITVDLEVEGETAYVPLDIATNLFSIAREALLNVKKHAVADHADVTLSFGEREVTLTVRDRGVGFQLEETLEKSQKERKFGLLGMRERTYRLGGTSEMTSARHTGTEIKVRIPYRR